MFFFSKHGCLFEGIFFFGSLDISGNHCYQEPLHHLLLTVILYGYFSLIIWGTTSYTFSRRLWIPCRSVMQRIWFRKWNMLHTLWKYFWIALGFNLLTKGSKYWLLHNFTLRCCLCFALAIYCIYFSARLSDATTFKRSHFKNIFIFFYDAWARGVSICWRCYYTLIILPGNVIWQVAQSHTCQKHSRKYMQTSVKYCIIIYVWMLNIS